MLQSWRLRLAQPVERALGRGVENENRYALVDVNSRRGHVEE